VVEGVYSMDGDVCALPDVVDVARKHGARVLIDEAHSTFLFGENGRGVAEHFGLDAEIDFHMGTFSKSLGGQGGFVCGSQAVIDYLNAFGRSRFFSCNLAPVLVAGIRESLRIAQAEPELRARLWQNVRALRDGLVAAGVDIGRSTSQILPPRRRHLAPLPPGRQGERAGPRRPCRVARRICPSRRAVSGPARG
jgi:glycine C-acetyltransferase